MDVILAATGALGVVVAALSKRLLRLPVTEPLLGLVAGVLLGPAVAGLIELPPLTEWDTEYHQASRVLLAVSVMAIALRYPIQEIRQRAAPVLLLLVVAMPVMAAVNTGLALAILGVAPAAALLLGTAMCPTDPVLASNVVSGQPAERDIQLRSRQLLSLESGANDGLAMPLVLLALFAAGTVGGGTTAWRIGWEVTAGVGIGILLGWLGGRALQASERHGVTEKTPVLFFTLLLALGVLGVAGLARANAILAVFVAGLAFNLVSTGSERGSELAIDEVVNRFLVLPLFLVLGAVLPWGDWVELGWRGPVLLIAVLLLRRLPIIGLLRRPLWLRWPDAAFIGWFGPVGVSALLYLTLQAEELGADSTVIAAGALVIAGSTVAHGLTASAGRVLYRRAYARAG